MMQERIERKWLYAFTEVFRRCGVQPGECAAILPQTRSRPVARTTELQLIAHAGAFRNVILGYNLGGMGGMGGMVAQELVALAPQTVHGLIPSGTALACGRAEGDWQQQFLQTHFPA